MTNFKIVFTQPMQSLVRYLTAITLFSLIYLPSSAMARADTQLSCIFSTVCLETNACSSRDLVVKVAYSDDSGTISTPGQEFQIALVQDGGNNATSILSEELNGSTAFLTIYANSQARLSFHFHRPEPTAMTNFGSCE